VFGRAVQWGGGCTLRQVVARGLIWRFIIPYNPSNKGKGGKDMVCSEPNNHDVRART
jgi:hypothetical protein